MKEKKIGSEVKENYFNRSGKSLFIWNYVFFLLVKIQWDGWNYKEDEKTARTSISQVYWNEILMSILVETVKLLIVQIIKYELFLVYIIPFAQTEVEI